MRERALHTTHLSLRTPTLLSLLLFCAPYLPWLIDYWQLPSSYVVGSPIALACAVIAYLRERHGPEPDTRPRPALGGAALVFFVVVHVAATILIARRSIAGAALAGVLAALFVREGGFGRVWRHRYTLGFVFFAAPIPGLVVDLLNSHLIHVAATLAAESMALLVSGSVREGNLIHLPEHGTLQVIADCSGLEGVVLFFVFACFLVFLHPRMRRIHKLLLPLLGVALALLGNLLRIVTTGLLQANGSSLARSETFHQVLGVGALAVALVLLFVLARSVDTRSGEPAR